MYVCSNILKIVPAILRSLSSKTINYNMNESGLAFIDVKSSNPYELFQEWREDATSNNCSKLFLRTFNLATASKNGEVSNRNVVVKELFHDGFTFLTSKWGRKTQHISENPSVAATFFWMYQKKDMNIVCQVRVEGKAEELNENFTKKYYEEELLSGKIRSHICEQGKEVDWNFLRSQHDQLLLDEVLDKQKELPMPETLCSYKIKPEMFDFYYAWNNKIADRVLFKKNDIDWNFVHLAA